MIVQFAVFGTMLVCAMVPFVLLAMLMRAGQTGFALTIISVIAATGVVFFYASGRPFGVDPVLAIGIVLLGCVPALLGCLAGTLLGWLLRKKDDKKVL